MTDQFDRWEYLGATIDGLRAFIELEESSEGRTVDWTNESQANALEDKYSEPYLDILEISQRAMMEDGKYVYA